MQRDRILVVDDEPRIVRIVRANLESLGFTVSSAADGAEALQKIELEEPDLVVLDLMLPRLDGIEVCRRTREFSSVPILMLTAKGQQEEKIIGLDTGADDYLTKPFDPEELLARVRALLRRSRAAENPQHQSTFTCGDIHIDFAQHLVTKRAERVKLSPTEYRLLYQLAVNANRILLHEDLLSRAWGPEFADDVDYLRVCVRRLRRQIEDDPSHPRYLLTEPGIGYRLRTPKSRLDT